MAVHDSDTAICYSCVADEYLRAAVCKNGESIKCGACGSTSPSLTVAELAQQIGVVLDEHFKRTPDEPEGLDYYRHKDKDDEYEWARAGQPIGEIIAQVAGLTDDVADAVREHLHFGDGGYNSDNVGEEEPFSRTAYYEERPPDDSKHFTRWRSLIKSIQHESRYCNPAVIQTLDEIIYEGIRAGRDGGIDPVMVIGPTTDTPNLMRARVFQQEAELVEALRSPEQHLGPPPPSVGAGRMNARGVAVFYGTTTAASALAEVRPPVGSSVVVGTFGILQQLRVLDLRALGTTAGTGSLFDQAFVQRIERAAFLRRLRAMLACPVLPADEEDDYLITQIIAEYLASKTELQLQGIAYPSSQTQNDGLNIVLFHQHCKVQPYPKDPGRVAVDTYQETDDGPEPAYWVIENSERPDARPPSTSEPQSIVKLKRKPVLALDRRCIEVHQVHSVSITTSSSLVGFIDQREMDDAPF